MGKPFRTELDTISDTYSFSIGIDYTEFDRYLRNNICAPFLIVGSGGSFSVALSCAQLIEALGGFAKAITPYELVNSLRGLQSINVILFTASGSNTDIINAYSFCRENLARSTFILCLKESSKLVAFAKSKYGDHGFLEVGLPHGRDGFLAVNSSVCALGIFERILSNMDQTPHSLDNIGKSLSNQVVNCLDAHSIVALGGHWTTPVIADFESKCTEAGLINVLPADLRNFAHGRHHWLSKNPDTSVVCFVTKEDLNLAERTLRLLPMHISRAIIVSSNCGISATIELLVEMFTVSIWWLETMQYGCLKAALQ